MDRVCSSQCLWCHNSVKNASVKLACVDLYDGNDLSRRCVSFSSATVHHSVLNLW